MTVNRRITSFLLLAFGISWAIAGVGSLLGVDTAHRGYTILTATCMLGPAIAALVRWRLAERAPWSALGLHLSRIQWRQLGVTVTIGACIIPLSLLAIHVFGDHLHLPGFGHVEVSGKRLSTSVEAIMEERGVSGTTELSSRVAELPGALILLVLLASAVVAAFTVNLPFMLGEELGWRGYLYAVTAEWSPAQRIALTGPAWGLWHAPLIMMGHNYPGHPYVGVLVMMVFCSLLAVLFDHSRFRVESVWGPCVLHGIINGSAGAFALFTWDGHVLVASPAAVAGFIALAVLIAAVFAFDPRYRRSFFHKPADLGSTNT